MAPSLLFDLTNIDLDHVRYDTAAVEQALPHRGHMRLLDGVNYIDDQHIHGIGFKDVRDDEFWVAGHIPGRPLMPGVLMLETAAQLACFLTIQRVGNDRFLGFTGAESVKFRGQVVPGDRLVILAKESKRHPRRFVSAVQALVNGKIVFEATVKAMPI
jgi:3-hydroxyacyl-[acyl-carrier-protein] dehydratase